MERLHNKNFISNPASKAKSVILTQEGLKRAEAIFARMFAKAH
jgi:hypothetical protein